MTESCKEVVVYKTKPMSHHNIYLSKGGHQPHPSRQAEVSHGLSGGQTSDFDRDDSEASIFTGSSSTFGDDSHLQNVHQGSGSPGHSKPDPENHSLGNSIFYDDPDAVDISGASSSPPDPILTAKAIERTKQKIENIKDQIRLEQVSKEENVNEFLKLCANADDRQQHTRMKQLFEKKNQKSAQTIAQLQKKLEEYQKRLRNLEEHGVHQKPKHKVREKVQGLKNAGGNFMSKPKELAVKLRHKFGSADNLTTLHQKEVLKESRNPMGSASLPRDNLGGRGPALYASEHQDSFEEDEMATGVISRHRSTVASEKSDATSESMPPVIPTQSLMLLGRNSSTEWKSVMQELTMHKEEVERLREELDDVKLQIKHEIEGLREQVREEKERFERLEEQMNDLTELHQHEVENIKSGVRDMEEKVQYQSEERLMDIKEHLQGLEAKVNSLEHQQAQQQYINIDGLENSDARVIFMKLLTAIITFIHIGLYIVGTFLSLAKPFLRTKFRVSLTFLILLISFFVYQKMENLDEFFTYLTTNNHRNVSNEKIESNKS